MKKTLILFGFALCINYGTANSAGQNKIPEYQEWSWTGIWGRYDKEAVKRGYQVYSEVCSSCHGMNLLSYRNLKKLGLTEDEILTSTEDFEVEDGPDDEGEMFTRAVKLSDKFVSPYMNENEARASNEGALPPDLSLIVKARAVGKGNIFVNLIDSLKGSGSSSGADYIYSLLTNYKETPPDNYDLPEGKYYNEYFSSIAISMAPPLSEDSVEYEDGTVPTLSQHARDVTTFLSWAGEQEHDERKSLGWKVILYLTLLWLILLICKKRIWRDVYSRKNNN